MSEPKEPTREASRLVWWLVNLALQKRTYEEAKVGDHVVETTHALGLVKHRLGFIDAVGELIAIEKDERGNRIYTIRNLDGKEQRWENASFSVLESRTNTPSHHETGVKK